MVSSTEGWPTNTGWNRRSRAASFSMLVRYSSSVVAPTSRSSPRASMGLIMLPASMAPSALPAPTMVWSSSMKVMTSPPASVISLSTALSRSSNSPRYLAPATIEPRSRLMTRLVLQTLGHVALDDAAGEALDDGGLADTGLADQDGVVLGASGQHLDDPADLLVAADDRIELALAGRLGEVAAVLLEGLVAVLGVLAGDPVAAPDLAERGEQLLLADAEGGRHGEQEVLGGEVLVAELGALAVGVVEGGLQGPGEPDLRAVGLGERGDGVVGGVAQRQGLLAHLGEHRQHDALVLAEEGGQQVIGGDLGVRAAPGQLGGGVERLLGLDRPAVRIQRHSGGQPTPTQLP